MSCFSKGSASLNEGTVSVDGERTRLRSVDLGSDSYLAMILYALE